jgi:hypothetical protein
MSPIIPTEKLKGYKNPTHTDDYFIETADKKYALYFYNIEEVTMMAYFANLAIFAENKFDSPVLSSDKVWIWYSNIKTFTYAQKSACLIFKTSVRIAGELTYPYLLINPLVKQFAFLDWDVTSLYYFLEEVEENIVLVKEGSSQSLDKFNYVRRTGEMIDLKKLTWYDFTLFDDAREIYINRKG